MPKKATPKEETQPQTLDEALKGRRIQRLVELGAGLEIWRVHVDELREQTKNARSMDPQTFDRLAGNIAKDGRLEQLPFCAALWDEKLLDKLLVEIVSGHHRVRAARKAHLMEIPVLVDVTNLGRSAVVSKQLSHNAIAGKDNDDMLAQLYREMDRLQDMIASHIDPFELRVYEPLNAPKVEPVEVDFQRQTVTLVFLPSQLTAFDELCKAIPPSDAVRVVPAEDYQKFVETMRRLGKHCDIRAVGSALSKMCDLAGEWLDQQPEADAPPAKKPAKRGQRGTTKRRQPAKRVPKPPQSAIAAYAEAKRREADGKQPTAG